MHAGVPEISPVDLTSIGSKQFPWQPPLLRRPDLYSHRLRRCAAVYGSSFGSAGRRLPILHEHSLKVKYREAGKTD